MSTEQHFEGFEARLDRVLAHRAEVDASGSGRLAPCFAGRAVTGSVLDKGRNLSVERERCVILVRGIQSSAHEVLCNELARGLCIVCGSLPFPWRRDAHR